MVGKVARGGTETRRGVEIDTKLGQRRQAGLAANLALEDLEAPGHRGTQERRHGEPGLEDGIYRFHAAHLADRAPVAPGLAQRLHRDRPEHAGRRAQRDRQRILQMGIAARRADPDQPVGAQGLAMAATLGLGGERKIDAARPQLLAHYLRVLAYQADAYPR